MKLAFQPKGMGAKAWALDTDSNKIIYGNKEIPLRDITDIELTREATARSNAMITVTVKPGVPELLYVCQADDSKMQSAINYVKKHIDPDYEKNPISSEDEDVVPAPNEGGVVYSLNGVSGKHLDVYENKVVLSIKKGFWSSVSNEGQKTIYYTDCTSVQFRKCGGVTTGYLQFETASVAAKRGNPASNQMNENSFVFNSSKYNAQMQEVYEYISKKVEECKNPKTQAAQTSQTTVSKADEIMKFKQLLDMGAITEEEYETEKRKILNRD